MEALAGRSDGEGEGSDDHEEGNDDQDDDKQRGTRGARDRKHGAERNDKYSTRACAQLPFAPSAAAAAASPPHGRAWMREHIHTHSAAHATRGFWHNAAPSPPGPVGPYRAIVRAEQR